MNEPETERGGRRAGMDGVGPWLAGAAMTLLALFGLALASAAVDGPFHAFGLALFAFGIACIFALIARHTGHHGAARAAPPEPAAAAPTTGTAVAEERPQRERVTAPT